MQTRPDRMHREHAHPLRIPPPFLSGHELLSILILPRLHLLLPAHANGPVARLRQLPYQFI